MADLHLDLEHITALSREHPPRVAERDRDAAQPDALKAARTTVELLAVIPGSGQAARTTRADEASRDSRA
ncbi:hypothetical protein [Streptomyces gossypiisoli]|uniref:hypothetical protein n=1 Tax=Streptomyces gossypiisoli TaxID=2748864 RepID=UPI0015DB9F67|nr:hypothetical protein [Streptomyces gossypiisoli]